MPTSWPSRRGANDAHRWPHAAGVMSAWCDELANALCDSGLIAVSDTSTDLYAIAVELHRAIEADWLRAIPSPYRVEHHRRRYHDRRNAPLIDEIISLEWDMFAAVQNAGGPTACQQQPETFDLMRRSQYLTWPAIVLCSYRDDLRTARDQGRTWP